MNVSRKQTESVVTELLKKVGTNTLHYKPADMRLMFLVLWSLGTTRGISDWLTGIGRSGASDWL